MCAPVGRVQLSITPSAARVWRPRTWRESPLCWPNPSPTLADSRSGRWWFNMPGTWPSPCAMWARESSRRRKSASNHCSRLRGSPLPRRLDCEVVMAKVNLSVSVKHDHLPRFSDLVSQMKKTGFNVDQELASAGGGTGSLDDYKVPALRKLTGVAHIEESRTIQIPSPDSQDQ